MAGVPAPRRAALVGMYAAGVIGVGYALWHTLHDIYHQSKPAIDLHVYLTGASAILHGQPLYSVVSRDGLPFTYPPFAAVLFTPGTALGTGRLVELVVAALSFAALARSCWLLVVHVRGDGLRAAAPATWAGWALLLGLACLMEPFLATLSYGQVNLVLLWLVLEDGLGLRPGSRLRGVGFGIAAAVKLTPLILLPYLWLAGRRAAAVRMGAVFLGAVVVGAVVRPSDTWTYWTSAIFDTRRIGDTGYISNQALRGALQRTGLAHASVLWLALALVVAAVGLWYAAAASRAGAEVPALALVLLTMLLVSPFSWTHHWVALLPLMAVLLLGDLGSRAARLALVLGWLAATVTYVVWKVAPIDTSPYGLSAGKQVLGSSYTLLGCVSLVWLVLALRSRLSVTGRPPAVGDVGDVRTAGRTGSLEP